MQEGERDATFRGGALGCEAEEGGEEADVEGEVVWGCGFVGGDGVAATTAAASAVGVGVGTVVGSGVVVVVVDQRLEGGGEDGVEVDAAGGGEVVQRQGDDVVAGLQVVHCLVESSCVVWIGVFLRA